MKTIRRVLWLLLAVLVLAPAAWANQAATGWCELGGQAVVTSGLTSTSDVQASYPGCTVTVSVVGGGLATIFSDNSGTPLSNPFTASATTGQWTFYAQNGRYSIALTGGTPALPQTVTISDVILFDGTVVPTLSGANTFTGTNTFTGLIQCKNFENVLCVDAANSAGWSGTDAFGWISAALASTPCTSAQGCIVDARGLGQSAAVSTPIAFPTSKPFELILGATNFTYTGTYPMWTFNYNNGFGSQIVYGCGEACTILTVNNTTAQVIQYTDSQHISTTDFSIRKASGAGGDVIDAAYLQHSVIDRVLIVPNTTTATWVNGLALGVDSNGSTLFNRIHLNIQINSVGHPAITGDCFQANSSVNAFTINGNYVWIDCDGNGGTSNGFHLQTTVGASPQVNENEFRGSASANGTCIKQDSNSTRNSTYFLVTCETEVSGVTNASGNVGSRFIGVQFGSSPITDTNVTSVYLSNLAGTQMLGLDSLGNAIVPFGLGVGPSLTTANLQGAGSIIGNDSGNGLTLCNTTNCPLLIRSTGLLGNSAGRTLGGATNGSAFLSLYLAGSGSGTTQLLPSAAAGTTVATFPSNTGTVAELNLAQSWTAAQSFGAGDILPTVAGATDLGSTALPFGNLWLGTAATNNIEFSVAATAAARTITYNDPLANTTVSYVVAKGTTALTSGSVGGATCQTTVTTSATGAATTDRVVWSYATAPTVTTDALLHTSAYTTANNVGFTRCNGTAGSITGTAIVVNWAVLRTP